MATSFRSRERCGDDQVRNPHFVYGGGGAVRCGSRGGGKAQLSLERILRVIASRGGGEVEAAAVEVKRRSSERGGADLNREAVVVGDESESAGGGLRSTGEDCKSGEGAEAVNSAALIDVMAGGSDGAEAIAEGDAGMKAGGDGDVGHLNLLIEAAQLVGGRFKEEEEKDEPSVSDESTRNSTESGSDGLVRKSQRSKRSRQNGHWMTLEEEDISPVVKSKRGRTQVLPYRYRDSVIEPLKRCAGAMKRRLRRED